MNKQEIAVLLREVAVTDKRTVGPPDVEVWSAILTDDIPLSFARQAVIAHFREKPEFWLNPGHIVERWRAYKHDKLARESDEQREARQAELDARLQEAIDEVRTELPSGAPQWVRPDVNALLVPCPWCRSGIGQRCTFPNTTEYTKNPHPSRVDAAVALHNEKQEA
jgi:hypothetical protein